MMPPMHQRQRYAQQFIKPIDLGVPFATIFAYYLITMEEKLYLFSEEEEDDLDKKSDEEDEDDEDLEDDEDEDDEEDELEEEVQ